MRILGIEFGTWSVKAVEMESRFRRWELVDFIEARLPLQSVDASASYRQAMQEVLKRVSGRSEKIITSLPASQTALRFLQVPVKARKKVEQMYRFELEDNVPFKLEDAIIEHHVTRVKDGSLVFAAMGLKKHIQGHVEWLRSIGVDPDWLTFDGMGIVNLYLSSLDPKTMDPAAEPVMVLDLGHQKTNVSIYDQDRLQLFRTVAWGGAQITQSIAMGSSLALEDAEKRKIHELKLDADLETLPEEQREMVLSATQAFTSFLADVNHSLVAFRTLYGTKVGSLVITGGTSKTHGIESFLSKSLDIPVSRFKSFEKFTLKKAQNADEDRMGEALGRAFVSARQSTLLFNFRKGDMGKETSLTEVTEFLKNPNIVTLLKYAAVFAVLLLIHVNVASYVAEREAKASTEELRKVFSNTFPEAPTKLRSSLTSSPKELRSFIKKKVDDVDKKLKLAARPRKPMLTTLLAVTNSFPKDVRVDVNKLAIDDRILSLEGVLYDGDIAKVTESLKKLPNVSKVELQRDGQRFTYRGEIGGN